MKKKLIMSLLAGIVLLGGARIVPAAALETEIQEEADHADDTANQEAGSLIEADGTVPLQQEEPAAVENGGVPLDREHFPNASFYKDLQQYDKNLDGVLSTDEISEIKKIIFDQPTYGQYSIPSVAGIEYLVALEEVEFKLNPDVTTVDFSSLPHLKTVLASDTSFTELDFTNNPELEMLTVPKTIQKLTISEENKITEFTMREEYEEEAPKWTSENCSNLSLSLMRHLKKLQLAYWNCPFDLSVFPDLETLTIYGEIEDLDLTANVNLKKLWVGKLTQQKQLDLSNNTKLKKIYISTDSLAFLDTEDCPLAPTYRYSRTLEYNKKVQVNSDGYYDLAKLPGYRADRFRSVSGAKIKGSKLYPMKNQVTYRYYTDSKKDSRGHLYLDFGEEIVPPAVEGIQAKAVDVSTVQCSWNKPEVAYDEFVVCVENEASHKRVRRMVVKKGTTSCKVTGLEAGKEYTVTVQNCRVINGKKLYSNAKYAPAFCYTPTSAPTLKASASGAKVKLAWDVKKAKIKYTEEGDIIYYKISKNGKYRRLMQVTNGGKSQSVSLKEGKTYYFKMRHYIRDRYHRDMVVFSKYSNTVKVTL